MGESLLSEECAGRHRPSNFEAVLELRTMSSWRRRRPVYDSSTTAKSSGDQGLYETHRGEFVGIRRRIRGRPPRANRSSRMTVAGRAQHSPPSYRAKSSNTFGRLLSIGLRGSRRPHGSVTAADGKVKECRQINSRLTKTPPACRPPPQPLAMGARSLGGFAPAVSRRGDPASRSRRLATPIAR